jgi:hypothetical protein
VDSEVREKYLKTIAACFFVKKKEKATRAKYGTDCDLGNKNHFLIHGTKYNAK